jgi:hypothetical protein
MQFIGKDRDYVRQQWGPPVGTATADNREILIYAEGRLFFRDGLVVEVGCPLSPNASGKSPGYTRQVTTPKTPPESPNSAPATKASETTENTVASPTATPSRDADSTDKSPKNAQTVTTEENASGYSWGWILLACLLLVGALYGLYRWMQKPYTPKKMRTGGSRPSLPYPIPQSGAASLAAPSNLGNRVDAGR